MNNTFIILKRLNSSFAKQQVLLVGLLIQNVILSLVVLIYANNIISAGMITGEIDYIRVSLFYNFTSVFVFLIISFFIPLFLSNTINVLYENKVIDHLLSVRISISDIVIAVYLRGLLTTTVLVISSFPIISISYYFGGFGIVKIVKLFVILIVFEVLISSICMKISTSTKSVNFPLIASYFLSIILTIYNIFLLKELLNSFTVLLVYIILSLIVSLILLSFARKTNVFNS